MGILSRNLSKNLEFRNEFWVRQTFAMIRIENGFKYMGMDKNTNEANVNTEVAQILSLREL